MHGTIDSMSVGEVEEKLVELRKKLAELRDNAEAAGNYTGAIAAEKYRGMVAGLYVDRKEIMHGTIDSMSVGEVEEKLVELRKKLSIPGNYEVIEQETLQGESVGSDGDSAPDEDGQLSIQDAT